METYSGYNIKVLPPYEYEEERHAKSQHANTERYEKPLNEDLELSRFKIFQCEIKVQHNHKQCRFFHSNKDRRRPKLLESSDLCKVAQKVWQDAIQYIKNDEYDFVCPQGDGCSKCHNKVEQLYCLEKYKTKFCTYYPQDCVSCYYGEYCSFAHRENEIRMDLIHHYEKDIDFFIFHYKTLWCPFNYVKHDRSHCVYAHNWQDYRRKPHLYTYEPVSCAKWNPNNFITKYEAGSRVIYSECSQQLNCGKCHGWKELEYHPKNYKMRPCSNGMKCPKGEICPYYHSNSEKRYRIKLCSKLSDKIKNGFFIYYPRNRKIQPEGHVYEDIKQHFTMDFANKTGEELDSGSDCSSEASLQADNKYDEIMEEMVKKIIGPD